MLDVRVKLARDVLVERATEANIETLAAIANSQDRLARYERVFQDAEIRLLSICVSFMRLCVSRSVVEGRVNVRGSSWEHESVQVIDYRGKLGF